MVNFKQGEDFNDSFVNMNKAQWFFDKKEPKSKSGKNKGLTLVLDAHTDLIETGTISDDQRVSSGTTRNTKKKIFYRWRYNTNNCPRRKLRVVFFICLCHFTG